MIGKAGSANLPELVILSLSNILTKASLKALPYKARVSSTTGNSPGFTALNAELPILCIKPFLNASICALDILTLINIRKV
jgi:hypothetical protein